MERRKEAMPISNPGQSTLASVESARVNDRRRGTYTIKSVAWSTGGSPGVVFSRWMALFFWLARSMRSRLWLAVLDLAANSPLR